jgi:heme A synthase
MQLNSFARFAWGVLTLNLGVILWGAVVRATGSGAGCGSHWPLCNGTVVPLTPPIATLIEFAHRLSSGLAFLVVVAMVVWARRAYPAGHRVRWGAGAAMACMIAETLAGAGLVVFHWVADDVSLGRVIVMPIHLTITFSLFTALALTAWWASGGAPLRLSKPDATTWLLGGSLLATLITGMAGAITALGDTVLPVASLTPGAYANLASSAQLLVGLRVWHPLIAIVDGAFVLFVANHVRVSRAGVFVARFSTTLTALFLLELGAGALNVFLQVPVWMQLTHLWLANLVWITLVLLTAAALGEGATGLPVRPIVVYYRRYPTSGGKHGSGETPSARMDEAGNRATQGAHEKGLEPAPDRGEAEPNSVVR